VPQVWIPSQCRDLTGGAQTVTVEGANVRELLEALDKLHPGLRERLCVGDSLRSGIQVIVDGQVAPLGLRQAVPPSSEVHFLPAIGGG
jgi:molybdopterin synthase sulfur carrier subunit